MPASGGRQPSEAGGISDPRGADASRSSGDAPIAGTIPKADRPRTTMEQRTSMLKSGDRTSNSQPNSKSDLQSLCRTMFAEVPVIEAGGGPDAIARQHAKNRMTVR